MKHYKTKDGKLMAECGVCGLLEKSGNEKLKHWEMKHLHFADADIDILTCNKCKKLTPGELGELLEEYK